MEAKSEAESDQAGPSPAEPYKYPARRGKVPAPFMKDKSTGLWKCHLCSYMSQYRGSLRSHYTVHSNERPFACDQCAYEAKRSYDLKKHMIFKHGKKNLPMRKVCRVPSTSALYAKYGFKRPAATFGKQPEQNQNCDTNCCYDGAEENQSNPNRQEQVPRDEIKTEPNQNASIELDVLEPSAQPGIPDLPFGSLEVAYNAFAEPESKKVLVEVHPSPEPSGVEDGMTLTAIRDRTSSESSGTSFGGHQRAYPGTGGSATRCLTSQGVVLQNCSPLDLSPSYHSPVRSSSVTSPMEEPLYDPNRLFTSVTSRRKSRPFRQPLNLSVHYQDVHVTDTNPDIASSTTKESSSYTKKAWHCQHCDIMFFDSAVYFMHAGIHSPDNAWKCNLCNNQFHDVYSFTSHLINRHK